MTERTQLGRRIERAISSSARLPGFFPVLLRALGRISSPLCSNRELEGVLMIDQALVFQLLRTANSAYYAVQGRVSSVSHAISIIGHDRLKTMLLQLLAAGLHQRISKGKRETEAIWRKSVAAAGGASAVAGYFPGVDADELKVAGLLHNIGELFLLSRFGDDYRRAHELDQPHEQAERHVFGMSARQVGRRLVEAWRLPRALAECVEHWPAPEVPELSHEERGFLSALHVGVCLGRAWSDEETLERAKERISPEILWELEASGIEWDAAWDSVPEHVDRVRTLVEGQ